MSGQLIIGQHVPWNAAWTGEERYEIRRCRFADDRLALWMPHLPGSGKPVFARPHMTRQRRSIRLMLCTVCGEHMPAENRWWFRLGHLQEGRFRTTEAPVHRHCADHALRVCPHLRGQEHRLEPLPGGYRLELAIMGGPVAAQDFGLSFPKEGVVGHIKLSWPAARIEADGKEFALIPAPVPSSI